MESRLNEHLMDPEATKIYKAFKSEWMREEEFKDWLKEVVGEPEKFNCNYCQRTYQGSRTEFKKHAKSQKHIKIAEMYKAGISRNEIQREKNMNASDYQKKFRLAWMNEENFKIWLLPVAGASDQFECSFCDKEYFGGKSEIIKHFKSSKHKIIQEIVNNNEEVKQEYIKVVALRLKEINDQSDHDLPKSSSQGFKIEYLEIPEFKNWLIACEDDPHKFGCSICGIEIIGGKNEIKDHMKSQNHISFQLNESKDENHQFLVEIDEESVDVYEQTQEIEDINDEEFDVYDNYPDSTVQEELTDYPCEIDPPPDQLSVILNSLYDSAPDTSDVYIICANNTILYAHKIVLAAACEFFGDIFKSSVHFDLEKVIHIYLPDFSYEVVSLFLQFLYTGQVNIPSELIAEFKDICYALKIRSHLSNPEEPDMDPILADLASFVTFQENQKEFSIESLDDIQPHYKTYEIEEIEEVLEPTEEQEQVFEYELEECNLNKALEELTSGNNIQLVSLRYNIDEKILIDSLYKKTHHKLKRKLTVPPGKEQKNKKLKNLNNPKTVFQLRAEQSNFKKRLQDAVNSIKGGSSLSQAEEQFGIPIQVLQRNIKGII